MKTKTIKIKDIVIDAGTQQREKINDEIVAEYSEAMKCGAQFPAVTVFFNGAEYYLVDGFHRYWAHKSADIENIEADVHEGTKRDARLFSAGVNNTHGIRLTNQDKRKAVLVLIEDEEWSEWSDNKIAKHCKVTQPFVSKIRKEVITVITPINSNGNNDEVATVATSALEPALNRDDDKKLSTGNEENHEEFDEKEQAIIELKDTIISLDEENTRLKDALAANQLPEDEIQSAAEIIAELRARVKALEAELDAVKSSRDSYMVENGELKKQCASQRNQLKKFSVVK